MKRLECASALKFLASEYLLSAPLALFSNTGQLVASRAAASASARLLQRKT